MDLYLENALQCSKETTNKYSTSFSLGVRLLDKSIRDAIYAIYGFVRFADEIVDTFYNYNQHEMLETFKQNTYIAISNGISMNPILHSFQWAVNKYKIDHNLIESFLYSMEMDLTKTNYTHEEYKTYIYGSAEVVGLMCLQVFCYSKPGLYKQLIKPARKLGEAFQKVNFLRDMKSDFVDRGRTYFPNIDFKNFHLHDKSSIEKDIHQDFYEALQGIARLPKNERFGVYLAYSYYLELLHRIHKTPAKELLNGRVRVSDSQKIMILVKSYVTFKLKRGKIAAQQARIKPYNKSKAADNAYA